MTPFQLSAKVVAARSAWGQDMLRGIRNLPHGTLAKFRSDWMNPAAAELQLRRVLEALLHLGRHVLARGLGKRASEYEDIARYLAEVGVLDKPAS